MSAHFNPPPGWPSPPSPEWQPAPKWQPEPSWPPAPEGWSFWVDDEGAPVDPPPDSYPEVSHTKRNIVAGCGCLTVGALLLLGSCGAILAAGDETPSEVTVTPTTTVTPTATVTPTKSVTPTITAPEPTKTAAAETKTVTPTVTVEPPPPPPPPPEPDPERVPEPDPEPDEDEGGGVAFFENCDAVRAAEADPIYRGDPGYSSKLDGDGDGVACEN